MRTLSNLIKARAYRLEEDAVEPALLSAAAAFRDSCTPTFEDGDRQ